MREDKRIRKKIGKKEIPVSFVHQTKKNPDGNDNLRDVKKKKKSEKTIGGKGLYNIATFFFLFQIREAKGGIHVLPGRGNKNDKGRVIIKDGISITEKKITII